MQATGSQCWKTQVHSMVRKGIKPGPISPNTSPGRMRSFTYVQKCPVTSSPAATPVQSCTSGHLPCGSAVPITSHVQPQGLGWCSHLEEGSRHGSSGPSPATCSTFKCLIQKMFTSRVSKHMRSTGTAPIRFPVEETVKTEAMPKKSE